jgi:hypothetical protein
MLITMMLEIITSYLMETMVDRNSKNIDRERGEHTVDDPGMAQKNVQEVRVRCHFLSADTNLAK